MRTKEDVLKEPVAGDAVRPACQNERRVVCRTPKMVVYRQDDRVFRVRISTWRMDVFVGADVKRIAQEGGAE